MIRRSFAVIWLLAAGAVLVLSSTAWSGTAGPWDGVPLWAWAVGCIAAGALAAAVAGVGRGRLALIAGAVGTALTLAAVGVWLREWWVLAHHTDQGGWWTFTTLTIEPHTPAAAPAPPTVSHQLTVAGYLAGALLLVALTAALGTLSRVAPRRQSPSA